MAKTAHAHKADTNVLNDEHKEHETMNVNTSPVHDDNAAASAADTAPPDYLAETVQLGGIPVTLKSDIYPGMVLSANDARILLTALTRQFKNNQDANALARSKRYATAVAKNDTEAMRENAAWTADQYAAAFVGYRPAVGDMPRESALEKLRFDAAGMVYDEMVAEHNELLAAATKAANGQPLTFPLDGSPMPKARGYIQVPAKPKKARGADQAAHDAAVTAWEERRKALLTKLLASPDYAARIQAKIDALSVKPAPVATPPEAPVTAGDDLDLI